LTTLNLTGCTSLGSLDCSGNQLTSLDVSSLTSLSSLLGFNNQLSSNALNTIFENLPEGIPSVSHLIIENNPGSDTCNRGIAINKGWFFGRLGLSEGIFGGTMLNRQQKHR
jgi:Leucine-rich repeat (LRR) protein